MLSGVSAKETPKDVGCRSRWLPGRVDRGAHAGGRSERPSYREGPGAGGHCRCAGAPCGSGRLPEQLIRPLLGQRQSSVFAIPSRRAVEAIDYAQACTIAAATSDPPRKVSRQGFAIFPKIREIDALLLARPDLIPRVCEVHPELAFWALNGGQALGQPKKVKGTPYGPGMALRRELLRRSGLLPEALIEASPPRGAAADDLLDALAGLTVALDLARGGGQSFPDPPGRDAYGLPIAIWTLRR